MNQDDTSRLGEFESMSNITRAKSISQRKSVSVKLQEIDKEGHYLLTGEDAELLQDVLQNKLRLEKTGQSEKRRLHFRELEFTRQLSTFDRQNPNFSASEFHGFFTLFWLGVTLLLVKVAANNWRIHGTIWGKNEIILLMFRKDVIVLGLSDFVLCWSTLFCLFLQRAILRGHIRWRSYGWVIQNIWQTAYLAVAIWWTYHRDWPWTHTVFMVLHCLTMLMKQHSYSTFNGYLSELFKKKTLLEARLQRLENSNKASHALAHTSALPTSRNAYSDTFNTRVPAPVRPGDRKRRSSVDRQSFHHSGTTDHLLSLSETIENGTPLEPDQMIFLKSLIEREIELLSDGLSGQFSSTNHYPRNLTVGNFCEFITLPTLIYELEYPRTEKINWIYVIEKTAATLGTIMVMIVVSQNWIYPVVMSTMRMKEELTLSQRLQEFPWVLSDLLFPFMMEYLLAFYVIWECVPRSLDLPIEDSMPTGGIQFHGINLLEIGIVQYTTSSFVTSTIAPSAPSTSHAYRPV
ncbi:hypothetical protein N7540_009636 [Penicillium herquei]|nr:hypothetical protein N7540_009636 [Penicillium herquei]